MSQVTQYSWNESNRLVGVMNPDGSSESYTYSGSGQRRSKSVTSGASSSLTQYVWDQQNLLQEVDGSGSLAAHYTHRPGMWGGLSSVHRGASNPTASGAQFNTSTFGSARFNQSSSADTNSFYYLFDQQANTRKLTTATAQVSDSYSYRAFGEEVSASGSTPNPLRYQGQYGAWKDSSTRIHMRARSYDPATGVWLSSDPVGFRGGTFNLFKFVDNNPIYWVDPNGLYNVYHDPGRDHWYDKHRGGPPPTRDWPQRPQLPVPNPERPAYQDPGRDPWYDKHRGGPPPTRDWPPLPPRYSPPPPAPTSGGGITAVYGRYCGPQTIPGFGPPVDALDACCQVHDNCFGVHGCTACNQYFSIRCISCNSSLCQCAANTNCVTAACIAMRAIVIGYACNLGDISGKTGNLPTFNKPY